MTEKVPLYKRLTIIYRVEPGCLGPQGVDYVESFCEYAKKAFKNRHRNFLRWKIIPRYDKSLPEVEFQLSNHTITREQTARYFATFEVDFDEFETDVDNDLADLVDSYFDR